MPITKFEEIPREEEALLDIANFGGKAEQRKIAVCERLVMKRDVNSKLYISYVFRDRNGQRIVGRQFNINGVSSTIDKSYEMINNAVIVTASMSVFYGTYLDVTQVCPVDRESSGKILDKFFNLQMPSFEEEYQTFSSIMEAFAYPRFNEVYNLFDTERKLLDGYDTNICHGYRSTPVLFINNFCTVASTVLMDKEARNMVLAYVFIQAILAASGGDSRLVLEQLSKLGAIVSTKVDVTTRLVFEIASDTLYLMFKFNKDIVLSTAEIARSIHESVYNLLKLKSDIYEREGVFDYENQLYRKG